MTLRPFLALLLLCASTLACAQGAAAPAVPERVVNGFRGARFGMGVDEVRTAIQRDFRAQPAAITEMDHPVQKTRLLVVRVDNLEPGPGTATVSYLFGAASKRLMHVNVVWETGAKPGDDERTAIAAAGLQLANYFRSENWRPGASVQGVPDPSGAIILFAGVDAKGAGIELSMTGIPLAGATGAAANPTGPASVRIAYSANTGRPDVGGVRAGTF